MVNFYWELGMGPYALRAGYAYDLPRRAMGHGALAGREQMK